MRAVSYQDLRGSSEAGRELLLSEKARLGGPTPLPGAGQFAKISGQPGNERLVRPTGTPRAVVVRGSVRHLRRRRPRHTTGP